MTAYFLDSSAAVKVYVLEAGSQWVRDLLDPANHHDLARITHVEIGVAFYRRVSGGSLGLGDADALTDDLRRDIERTFRVIEVNGALVDLGIEVARKRALRGYDCVQLAAALMANRARQSAGLDELVLVTADKELLAAAEAEGMKVEDPNGH